MVLGVVEDAAPPAGRRALVLEQDDLLPEIRLDQEREIRFSALRSRAS
jgi:hypothetical protein